MFTKSSAAFFTAAMTLALSAPAYGQSNTTGNDQELDEIIISATAIAATEKDSLQAVDILLADELEAKFDGSLGATLADLPGVSTTNFGPAVGRPVIRGLGGDRVRILTNGIDLIDASTVSTDHALSTEGLEAERVEVLRGAAAIPFGGNAIGGVINVIDGSIPSSPPEDGIDGRLYLGATSADDGSQLAGRAKAAVGNVIFQLEGLTREAGDVEVPGFAKSQALRDQELADDPDGFDPGPDGIVTNTAFDFQMLGAGVSTHGDWGYVGIAAREFESNYGLPLEDEDQVGIAMEQTRIDAMGEFNVGLGMFEKATFSAGYVDYQHGENANGELQTLFKNSGYEARGALINGAAGELWNGSVGAQFVFQDFSANGAEDFIPPGETTDVGIFGAQRYDLQNYGFEGGLRLETRKITPFEGEELDFQSVSGSVGTFYRPTEDIFTGISLARTERAPTNAELYSNGFHPATGTFEIGNVDLGKETALSVEGVLNADGAGWSFEGAVFYTSFDDFVFLSATGDEDTESESPIFAYFQDDATFTGIELYAEKEVGSLSFADLSVDGTFEYVRADTDTLGNVPYAPPLSTILGATLKAENWQFRADVEIVSSAKNQADFELPTDGYTFVDLQAQIRPFTNEDVKVIIGLENAFDEEGRLNTSQLKDVVVLPGRNLRASISVDF